MKHLVIYKIVFLLTLGYNSMCVSAQFSEDSSSIDAVIMLLKEQEIAWNKGNLERFMKGYWKSDSLVFVGSKGPTYGFDKTLLSYQIGYPDRAAMGKLHFDILFTKQWDSNTIHLIGKYTLTRIKDQPTGFFTLLFRRIDNSWKIVGDHSSSQID